MSEEIFIVRFDEQSSTHWSPDQDINRIFLHTVLNYMQDRLKEQGYLFLNEIYRELGLPRTSRGQLVGWIYTACDPRDFGIWAMEWDSEKDFVRLTFKTQGEMYTKIEK